MTGGPTCTAERGLPLERTAEPLGGMGRYRSRDVLGFVVNLRCGELDGAAELLDRPVPGDWIVRGGASKADLLTAMEGILGDELKRPISFAHREVEREVVTGGAHQFHSLGDDPKERAVHRGAESLSPQGLRRLGLAP